MDIGIFIEYNKRIVQIPVNPEKFEVSTEGNNQTEEIIDLGEIVIPRKKKLSTIGWSSFFPYEPWFSAVRTKAHFQPPRFYLEFIDKIRDDRKPCHLTVTGIGFDGDVVIESFNHYHQAGDHEDTYYTISFKKYVPYAVSILSKDKKNNNTSKKNSTSNKNSSTSVKAKDITVGCEVILNGTVHLDSYGSKPGKSFTNYKGKVNLINKKGSHPYHVTTPSGGWLGWVTKESVVLA